MRRHITAGIHFPCDIGICLRIHDTDRDCGRQSSVARSRRGKRALRCRRDIHVSTGGQYRIFANHRITLRFQRADRHDKTERLIVLKNT